MRKQKKLNEHTGEWEEVDLLLYEDHATDGTWFPAVYDPQTGVSYEEALVEALLAAVMELIEK
jgi:hypothetical protein